MNGFRSHLTMFLVVCVWSHTVSLRRKRSAGGPVGASPPSHLPDTGTVRSQVSSWSLFRAWWRHTDDPGHLLPPLPSSGVCELAWHYSVPRDHIMAVSGPSPVKNRKSSVLQLHWEKTNLCLIHYSLAYFFLFLKEIRVKPPSWALDTVPAVCPAVLLSGTYYFMSRLW